MDVNQLTCGVERGERVRTPARATTRVPSPRPRRSRPYGSQDPYVRGCPFLRLMLIPSQIQGILDGDRSANQMHSAQMIINNTSTLMSMIRELKCVSPICPCMKSA